MQKSVIFLVFILEIMVFPLGGVRAATASAQYVSRGEAVSRVVQAFDLQNKEKPFLNDCFLHLEDCFFVFGAMSHFDAIRFQPLVIYPDVVAGYRFYDEIITATMLGLVHGHLEEKNSPFHPRAAMTRIHALKVILGAAKLLPWKEKFEIAAQMGNENAFWKQKTAFEDHTWWYPRYMNFARESGFTENEKSFRPDEPITEEEFENFLQKAILSGGNLRFPPGTPRQASEPPSPSPR